MVVQSVVRRWIASNNFKKLCYGKRCTFVHGRGRGGGSKGVTTEIGGEGEESEGVTTEIGGEGGSKGVTTEIVVVYM